MSELKDSWNWVRWMHICVCLVLVAFVVLTFTVHNLNTLDMHVSGILLAAIFIGQHLLITCMKRWYRFDRV